MEWNERRRESCCLLLAALLAGAAACTDPAPAEEGCPGTPCGAGERCLGGVCKPIDGCPDRPCGPGEQCIGGHCTLPECEPRACPVLPACDLAFDDGCGSTMSCDCGAGERCLDLACCLPSCTGVGCQGSDGCGGSCPAACGAWVELTPELRPEPRDLHALAYDPDRGVVFLFGGRLDGGTELLADLWELSLVGPAPATGEAPEVSWQRVDDGVGLTGRQAPRLVFAWGKLLLYGGCAGPADCEQLLEWSGAGWLPVQTTGPAPGARNEHGLVLDERRNLVMLYGGNVLGDQEPGLARSLFTLDEAGGWSRIPQSGQPETVGEFAMVWDGNAGVVHLYGSAFTVHWILGEAADGSPVWQPDPDLGPGDRAAGVAVWEPPTLDGAGATLRTGRVVLYGGERPFAPGEQCDRKELGDSWELASPARGFEQAAVSSCTSIPLGRNHHAMTAAPALGGVFLFGGNPINRGVDDMYLLLRAPP